MKFRSVILLFVFVQGLIFSACGASPPAGVLQDLSGKPAPLANQYCHMVNLAADGEEACIIQDLRYSKKHAFQHVSGCSCFTYMNIEFINPNSTIRFYVFQNEYTTYPGFRDIMDPNQKNFPFHYNNSKAVKVLSNVFYNNGIEKWKQCAKDAMKCCNNMKQEDLIPADGYCTANWDAWTCLDKWPIRETQHKPCPDYIYIGQTPSCTHYSNKVCNESGFWSITASDYSTCPPTTMLEERYLYHAILLSVSIAVALPAIIIFFSYRKLWITRVILHRNLILAIVIRNIFSIVIKIAINTDALLDSATTKGVMAENPVWCRAVSFMDKLSTSTVYSCFLLECIFLHRLIAGALKGEPHMLIYYIGATGLVIVPIIVWTVVTVLDNYNNCWVVDEKNYTYILDGPRIFTLAVNVILMLDIVRVLCTKLRNVNTVKSNQTRRMTQATIMLIPLFGVQFLVTLVRPDTKDCVVEQVYYHIFYAMDGLQGALVALLYCYLNKEVQVQLLRTYSLLQARFYNLVGKEHKPKRRKTWAYSEHPRTTISVINADNGQRT